MKPLLKHVEVAELRGVSAGCAKLEIVPEVLGSEAVFPQARHNHLKPLRTLILSWMVHSKGSVLQPVKCFWADVPLTESTDLEMSHSSVNSCQKEELEQKRKKIQKGV